MDFTEVNFTKLIETNVKLDLQAKELAEIKALQASNHVVALTLSLVVPECRLYSCANRHPSKSGVGPPN